MGSLRRLDPKFSRSVLARFQHSLERMSFGNIFGMRLGIWGSYGGTNMALGIWNRHRSAKTRNFCHFSIGRLHVTPLSRPMFHGEGL